MILKGIKIFLLVVVGMFVFGGVVMLLWNALIPDLFKGPSLTYWQAIGLLILSHLLLRGWHPSGHRHVWRNDRWQHRFEEKLAAMTPEEREKFKEEWKHRCGWDPSIAEEKK